MLAMDIAVCLQLRVLIGLPISLHISVRITVFKRKGTMCYSLAASLTNSRVVVL